MLPMVIDVRRKSTHLTCVYTLLFIQNYNLYVNILDIVLWTYMIYLDDPTDLLYFEPAEHLHDHDDL